MYCRASVGFEGDTGDSYATVFQLSQYDVAFSYETCYTSYGNA